MRRNLLGEVSDMRDVLFDHRGVPVDAVHLQRHPCFQSSNAERTKRLPILGIQSDIRRPVVAFAEAGHEAEAEVTDRFVARLRSGVSAANDASRAQHKSR